MATTASTYRTRPNGNASRIRWKPLPSLRDVTLPQGNVAIGALVDVRQQQAQPNAWAIQNGNHNDKKRFLTIGGIRIQNPFSQIRYGLESPSSAPAKTGFHEGKSIKNCDEPLTNGGARKGTDSPSTCLPFVNGRSRERGTCPICEPYLAYLERLSFSELPSGPSSDRKASFDRPQ